MTAYLRNYWYLAAWAHEIGDKPLARTFFDRPAVLFRTEAGKITMLDDLCPHRFAALHRGRVLGEAIECPYHGLRFSPEGNCVHSPFSGKPPHAQQVRSYPVVETDGFVWFWYGDPERAADTPVPDLGEVRQTPTTQLIRLHNHMNADFMLGLDNLLEASHVGFLHRDSFSQGTDALAQLFVEGKYRSYEEGGRVYSCWQFSNVPSDYVKTYWEAPTLCVIEKGQDHSIPPRPRRMIGLHLFTPETEKSAHYFAVEAFDPELDPPGYGEMVAELTQHAFVNEDLATLEIIQRNMGDVDLLDSGALLLNIDAGTYRTRRAYRRLLQEQEEREKAARTPENAHA